MVSAQPGKSSNDGPKPHRTRSYHDRDLKILWGLSAGRCAFPNCRKSAIAPASPLDRAAIIGQIAHIVGFKDEGPRGDPDFPDELRNKHENLLILCGDHHPLVDSQDSTYSSTELRQWKLEHENWVHKSLSEYMPSVSFVELEFITSAMVNNPSLLTESFTIVPPSEKMERNGLTSSTGSLLTLGLAKAAEVESFVERSADLDPRFPEKLKAGFVAEYRRQIEAGLSGDALFEALRSFACHPNDAFEKQAAALAVLVYLFEKCEVF